MPTSPHARLRASAAFRAHTVDGAPNLLVAGKTMAQTFFANAVTRLHPTEWVSGTAAGVAAALMVRNAWTSQQMYLNRTALQSALGLPAIASPLEWTL